MGLFDEIKVVDADPERRFTCAANHSLLEHTFQTKDLGCTDGMNWKLEGGRIVHAPGVYGDPPTRPILGYVYLSARCKVCEVLTSASRVYVTFELRVIDDVVESVRLLPPPPR